MRLGTARISELQLQGSEVENRVQSRRDYVRSTAHFRLEIVRKFQKSENSTKLRSMIKIPQC